MAKYDEWITEEGLTLIKGWARDGSTDKEIATQKIGVAYSTFRDWKKKFPALSAALKESKPIADNRVEESLFKNAIGYEYEEITQERDEEGELVVTKIVRKYQKPDTTAQIFWLKNRRRDKWTDQQNVNHSGTIKTEHEENYRLEVEQKLAADPELQQLYMQIWEREQLAKGNS